MSPMVASEDGVGERMTVIDAVTVDRDAHASRHPDEIAHALSTMVRSGPLVMVVPGDIGRERFATLTEGAALAGLPTPTWVPDAVARAGAVLAALAPERPRLVVDARTEDTRVWGVRPAAAGGRIGTVKPVEIGSRVEDLLIAMIRAKVGTSAPRPAAPLVEHTAHTVHRPVTAAMRSDLQLAARRLAADPSAHARFTATADDVDVAIESRELAQAVAHAARSEAVDLFGADAADAVAVVVADDAGRGFVRHLATTFGAMSVVGARADAALDGTRALLRAHRTQPAVPPPAPPAAVAPAAVRDRPRWVVPALSSALVAALVGAGCVLITDGLSPATEPGPSAVAPAGPQATGGFTR